MSRPWHTGFFKEPVTGRKWLGTTNLAGDGQADLKHHGGPDKAVCVYPAANYPFWHERLGLDLPPGAFGENFTGAGQTETDACIGDVYEVGSALVEVSQPRSPCWKLARRWRVKDLALQFQETGLTGWYLRVLREGFVGADEPITLRDRPHPEWTVARANEVAYHRKDDRALAAALAACPALGESWRRKLAKRAEQGQNENERARVIGPNEDRRA